MTNASLSLNRKPSSWFGVWNTLLTFCRCSLNIFIYINILLRFISILLVITNAFIKQCDPKRVISDLINTDVNNQNDQMETDSDSAEQIDRDSAELMDEDSSEEDNTSFDSNDDYQKRLIPLAGDELIKGKKEDLETLKEIKQNAETPEEQQKAQRLID